MYVRRCRLTIVLCSLFYLLLSIRANFDTSNLYKDLFSDTYFIVASVGCLGSILAAQLWHNTYNNVGKALLFFGLGLLLQVLGQISYTSYYIAFDIANPYSTYGEIFYILSPFMFTIGIVYLYRGMGLSVFDYKAALENKSTQLVILTAMFLVLCYKVYAISADLLIAYYTFISLLNAVLTVWLVLATRHILQGAFSLSFILLASGFLSLHTSEVLYLKYTIEGGWQAGGISDIFCLIAYAFLGLGITTLGSKFYKPQDEPIVVIFDYESLLGGKEQIAY